MASHKPNASGDSAVVCAHPLAVRAALVVGPMATALEGASVGHVFTLLGEVKHTTSAWKEVAPLGTES